MLMDTSKYLYNIMIEIDTHIAYILWLVFLRYFLIFWEMSKVEIPELKFRNWRRCSCKAWEHKRTFKIESFKKKMSSILFDGIYLWKSSQVYNRWKCKIDVNWTINNDRSFREIIINVYVSKLIFWYDFMVE